MPQGFCEVIGTSVSSWGSQGNVNQTKGAEYWLEENRIEWDIGLAEGNVWEKGSASGLSRKSWYRLHGITLDSVFTG